MNADCMKPLEHPVLGTHDLSRVINVGMPKAGSSSLHAFFRDGSNLTSNHFVCRPHQGHMPCGICFKGQVENKRDPFANCGNHTVWTQMDFHYWKRPGIYPQIEYLDEIYKYAPNATFILTFRNTTAWVNSMTHWAENDPVGSMRKRLDASTFPVINWTKDMGKDNDKDYEQFVCNHVRQIRQFVNDHPTLSLVEYSIEGTNVGELLASVFPVDPTKYGKKNVNQRVHKEETNSTVNVTLPTKDHN